MTHEVKAETAKAGRPSFKQRLGRWARSLCTVLAVAIGLQSSLAQAQTVYFHSDGAGSPLVATDESGNLLWKESYKPYGDRMLKPAAANTQWFHGKQSDPDTGMSDFGARNYDPILGRFLSIDPVDFTDKNIHSFNRYAYGNDNPLKYKDPDGQFALQVALFVVGAGVDIVAQHFAGGKSFGQISYTSAAATGLSFAAGAGAIATVRSIARNAISAGKEATPVGDKGGAPLLEGPSAARGQQPGPATDKAGNEIGRIIVDKKGNAMIEPAGGSTVAAGKGGQDTHTLNPNGSNYQRLNPQGHRNNPTPHGHGHAPGTGPGMKGQGASLDVQGNKVPSNSPQAHWPIK